MMMLIGPRPGTPVKVFFRGGVSPESWSPGLKPLCHRHPAYPHPSGVLWSPWTPAKGDSTKGTFALALHPLLDAAVHRGVEHARALVDQAGLGHDLFGGGRRADAGKHRAALGHAGLGLGEMEDVVADCQEQAERVGAAHD